MGVSKDERKVLTLEIIESILIKDKMARVIAGSSFLHSLSRKVTRRAKYLSTL
jgi:hypothetical protein